MRCYTVALYCSCNTIDSGKPVLGQYMCRSMLPRHKSHVALKSSDPEQVEQQTTQLVVHYILGCKWQQAKKATCRPTASVHVPTAKRIYQAYRASHLLCIMQLLIVCAGQAY